MNPPDDKPSVAFRTLVVEPAHAGKRLDRFLVDAVEDLSRTRVREMIEAGHVRVDGRRARKGDAITAGATVELLAAPPPRDFAPIAERSLAITVRHEDPDVAVVEKPAGMPTHPLEPDETGTLAGYVAGRWPETLGVGFAQREPGLLHRLDTDTSGLLIVAKNAAAFAALRASAREGAVTKRYVALVEGDVPSEGRVDYPLVPHRKDPRRVEAVTPHVRLRAGTKTHEAHTRYRPVQRFRDTPVAAEITLVEVELQTAFRHQVRVHLATAGHPLIGDALYRGPSGAPLGLARHFLHASEVAFPHPRNGEATHVTSALPDDLARAIEQLRPFAR
jgi:23S rRNA pseudouridine1911/1915/1917 synthase